MAERRVIATVSLFFLLIPFVEILLLIRQDYSIAELLRLRVTNLEAATSRIWEGANAPMICSGRLTRISHSSHADGELKSNFES